MRRRAVLEVDIQQSFHKEKALLEASPGFRALSPFLALTLTLA
jgi:hypothetical protein